MLGKFVICAIVAAVTLLSSVAVLSSSSGVDGRLPNRDHGGLPRHIYSLALEKMGDEYLHRVLSRMSEPRMVSMCGMNVTMVQSKLDISIDMLKKEMNKDHYGVKEFADLDGTIVDVGANLGDFSMCAARIHPNMQIIAVEPAPETWLYCLFNLHLNNINVLSQADFDAGKKGVLLLNAGLSDQEGEINIQYNPERSQYTALDGDQKHADGADVTKWESHTVPSMNLARILERCKVKVIRLFKIDCEGCEYVVVPTVDAWLRDKKRVERFSAEIHMSLEPQSAWFSEKVDAPAADRDAVTKTHEILTARGCKSHQWLPRLC